MKKLGNCVELTSEIESYFIVYDAGVYELTDLILLKVMGYFTSNPKQHLIVVQAHTHHTFLYTCCFLVF